MKGERREQKRIKARTSWRLKSNRKILFLHEAKISGHTKRDKLKEQEIFQQFQKEKN